MLKGDNDEYRSILLINCGVTEDIRELLDLGKEVRAYVIDAHRPVHLNNLSPDNQQVRERDLAHACVSPPRCASRRPARPGRTAGTTSGPGRESSTWRWVSPQVYLMWDEAVEASSNDIPVGLAELYSESESDSESEGSESEGASGDGMGGSRMARDGDEAAGGGSRGASGDTARVEDDGEDPLGLHGGSQDPGAWHGDGGVVTREPRSDVSRAWVVATRAYESYLTSLWPAEEGEVDSLRARARRSGEVGVSGAGAGAGAGAPLAGRKRRATREEASRSARRADANCDVGCALCLAPRQALHGRLEPWRGPTRSSLRAIVCRQPRPAPFMRPRLPRDRSCGERSGGQRRSGC